MVQKQSIYTGDQVQVLEQYPVRGYLSTMENKLHFGLANIKEIDSLKIIWPEGKQQMLKNVRSNQVLTVSYNDAMAPAETDTTVITGFFEETKMQFDRGFKHDEVSFFDYGIQRLLPQKYSQLGPPLATGDVNGDGLEDFFVGGASYQSGRIFIQTSAGSFSSKDLVAKNKTSEDAAALFFDADGDKDPDLLIAEGSTEFSNSRTLNVPRIYLNDGRGNFVFDSSAIPGEVSTISQSVTVGDYDSDGDEDIFIGGRILANQYPESPRSYILQNNKGKFTDVTRDVCPSLQHPGLITSATWTDFNNDKKIDLVICGEWMPVRFFKNEKGKLTEITTNTGLPAIHGLWRSLLATDIDNDGDIDLVAGNMGNNNKYKTSAERPMMLYVKDIDGNETKDLIAAYHILNSEGQYELFPAIDRTEFAQDVPTIKKRFLLNKDYANVTMKDLLAEIDQNDMLQLRCDTTASLWIENLGNGSFKYRPLPLEAQFAPGECDRRQRF